MHHEDDAAARDGDVFHGEGIASPELASRMPWPLVKNSAPCNKSLMHTKSLAQDLEHLLGTEIAPIAIAFRDKPPAGVERIGAAQCVAFFDQAAIFFAELNFVTV